MKQVIEQTGLTDRAVRLYIANGLLNPSCEEAYSGRKKIDFSQSDVDLLAEIATLRKAGFSIPQIQDLRSGTDKAFKALSNFISEKSAEQSNNERVPSALKAHSPEQLPTIESICACLAEETVQRSVPDEDKQMSRREKESRRFYIAFAAVVICAAVIKLIFVLHSFFSANRFLQIDNAMAETAAAFFLLPLLPVIMAVVLIFLYIKPCFTKEKRTVRSIACGITVTLLIISIVSVNCVYFFTSIASPFFSSTDDPGNYLVIDTMVEDNSHGEIAQLFPPEIPDSACKNKATGEFKPTTKYHYNQHVDWQRSFDIFAQWELPAAEYEREKETMLGKNAVFCDEAGEWNRLYYVNDAINGYYYLIFAYNDDANTVRYIASFATSTFDDTLQPYFEKVDW